MKRLAAWHKGVMIPSSVCLYKKFLTYSLALHTVTSYASLDDKYIYQMGVLRIGNIWPNLLDASELGR